MLYGQALICAPSRNQKASPPSNQLGGDFPKRRTFRRNVPAHFLYLFASPRRAEYHLPVRLAVFPGAWIWIVSALVLSWRGLESVAQPAEATVSNLWSLDIKDSGDSTPAIAPDGTIYFGTFAGQLRAVSAEGKPKWTFYTGRGQSSAMEIHSSPALGADGTIYFGSRDRNFYALTPAGRPRWVFPTGAWVDSSPAIGADGTVYFGSWDKIFHALSPEGAKRWSFPTGGPVVSSPAIDAQGRIFFGSHDGSLYALSPAGERVWSFKTGGPIVSSPALGADGAVYFTSTDGFFYALEPDGRLRWKTHTGGITESSPVLAADGGIYLGVNTELWAFSPAGEKRWARGFGYPVESSAAVLADDSVCAVSRFGLLVNLVQPSENVWSRFLAAYGSASPAVSPSGALYIFDSWTNLTALSIGQPPARSSWPTFRANPRNTGLVNH